MYTRSKTPTKRKSLKRAKKLPRTSRRKSSLGRLHTSSKLRGFGRLFFVLLILGVAGYAGHQLLFSETFIISKTKLIQDGVQLDQSLMLSEINALKEERLLSIPSSELKEELKQKYPEVKEIRIKKRLPDTLEVQVTTYPILSNLVVYVEEFQRTYLINEIGYIAAADQEDSNLPYITMNREAAYNTGEQVFETNQLTSILSAIKLFEEKFNMKTVDVRFLEKAREFHLRTEKDFYLWLDLEQDFRSQLSRLKAAEQKLNIHSTPLQYIDLRIAGNKGEKVIFKRR